MEKTGGSDCFCRQTHLAVAPAVGDVDPVVQAPGEAIDAELRIPLAEAGQHDAVLVGSAIAVAIAQEPDVRRRGDEHAADSTARPRSGTAARRRRRSHARSGRRRRGPPASGSVRRLPRSDSRASRRHTAALPRPRRSPPGWPPPARRPPARSSAPGRPARTSPAPRVGRVGPGRPPQGLCASPTISRRISTMQVAAIELTLIPEPSPTIGSGSPSQSSHADSRRFGAFQSSRIARNPIIGSRPATKVTAE